MTADYSQNPAPDAPKRKPWKTALFLVGSLALSGVALVLWNRGELSRLRNHSENTEPAEPSPQMEEEVF